jgi:D-alanyl-D-alanine carboxypeptidase
MSSILSRPRRTRFGALIAASLALLAAVASPVAAAPRYAAFMVDAGTREILYQNAADEARHPASLTKMMTLYLVFDAIEAGRLRLTDPVPVSRHAASMQPSRLGLAVGQSISVDNAISVVAVKSANDIAVALAEKLGGSEPNFVAMMNAKAQQLGMRNTHYANACGLTDATNITTARDLAILGVALVHDHPRFYRYFSERNFVWNRANMVNHNHLLGKMAGLDGIKTGYTVDSGFTLAASAQRGNRRLIAVVLGEPSIVQRNRDASDLLEAGFSVLDRRGLGQAVTVASVLPTLNHTALRLENAIEQGDSDESDRPARRLAPARLVARPRAHLAARVPHHPVRAARAGKSSRKAAVKTSSKHAAAHGSAKKGAAKKAGSKSKPTHHHRR